jgi:chorismate--pyruvate lyase
LSFLRSFIYPSYTEPVWRPMLSQADFRIPKIWHSWLADTGSLTDRLLKLSHGDLRVQIINQGLQQPRLSERQQLGLDNRISALVREVILFGLGQPWVFARSIVPLNTMTGRLRKLRQLDSRPLGALLFNDPTMTREAVQVANFQASKIVNRDKILANINPLWGRRSVFRLDKKPLLVSEIFLQPFTLHHQ